MNYIYFDVDKIKDYVFESFKPREVKGASEMIKCLDYYSETRMGELMRKLMEKFKDIEVVYAKGGGGLLKANDSNGQEICDWLEKNFSEYLKEGGSVTAVCHKKEKEFKISYAILNYLVRNRKSEKSLTLPLRLVEFQGEKSKCDSCGKRVFKHKIQIKNQTEPLRFCTICYEKRQKGKTKVQSLEDISDKELLVIYGDLNEAGAHLARLEKEEDLVNFSEIVYQTLRFTRIQIEKLLRRKGFKYLMPVIGGDDMIIFTHPNSFELIKDLLFSIEGILEKRLNKPVKMNFSFLVAKHNFPIIHLFRVSEKLLSKTKERYYMKDSIRQTHYGFFWLWEGGRMPSDYDVYLKSDFLTLFEMAKEVHNDRDIHRSAIHTLLELIPDEATGEEKQMNLEYFLARHKEFEDYILYEDGKLWPKREKNLRLTKDVWEDIIRMENLFYAPFKENEEGQ